MSVRRIVSPAWLVTALLVHLMVASAWGQNYPAMVYGAKRSIGPGTTWQVATHTSPAWVIHIIEVDLEHRGIDLQAQYKAEGLTFERTSSIAARTDALAAVNAAFFDGQGNSVSYGEVDGTVRHGNAVPRSVFGLTGNHNARLTMPKVASTTPDPPDASFAEVLDAIGGLGRLVRNGVVDIDREGAPSGFDTGRNPRTLLGWQASPRRVWLVTVDGRQTASVGMTFDEAARLLVDLGCQHGMNYDGGGSTTAWVRGRVVNSPSDGSERSVVNAWCVVPAYTIDNTDEEFSTQGGWSTSNQVGFYDRGSLIASGGDGSSRVTWRPNLHVAGTYKVYAWWAAASNRSTAARYFINHRDGVFQAIVDQTAQGGQWNLLGEFPFQPGTEGHVSLSNLAQAGTFVSADAVRFVHLKRLIQRWRVNVQDYPWFQNDGATRAFAWNPATGNAVVGSHTAGGGVFALSGSDGAVVRQLGGSAELVRALEFGAAATTRSGRIFVCNIQTAAGQPSRVHFWSSETASAPVTLETPAPARVGDSMDAFEDDAGNIVVVLNGSQGTVNPTLLRWRYAAATRTWSADTLVTSGNPETTTNRRMVTLVPNAAGTDYEIWVKGLSGGQVRYSSTGAYLGAQFSVGTGTTSNFYRGSLEGQTVEYMASGPYNGSGTVTLHDARDGFGLETAALSHANTNSNASGRLAVGVRQRQLIVFSGITNNSLILYESAEPSLVPPAATSGFVTLY